MDTMSRTMRLFESTSGNIARKTFRAGMIVMTVFLFFSIGTLALAIVYGVELSRAPQNTAKVQLFLDGNDPWSRAWAVFYCGTVPLISTLLAAAAIALHYRKAFSAMLGLIISVNLAFGWIMIFVFWFLCDFVASEVDGSLGFCYQSWLAEDYEVRISIVSDAIYLPKFTFAAICMVLSWTLIGLYAAVVHKQRMARRNAGSSDFKSLVSEHEMS